MVNNEPRIHLKEDQVRIFVISFNFVLQGTKTRENMKILIFFAVVLSVAYVQAGMTEEQIIKMFSAKAKECQGPEGGSEDDIAGLVAMIPPSTKEAKCVLACIAEKDGIVSVLIIS